MKKSQTRKRKKEDDKQEKAEEPCGHCGGAKVCSCSDCVSANLGCSKSALGESEHVAPCQHCGSK